MEKNIPLHSQEMVPVESLTFDGHNPNRMNAQQFEALKKNIRDYGFTSPVVVDKDGVVADGEHRVRAAKELGLKEIPVIRLDVNETGRKIIRQVMNKLKGNHDIELDIQEYKRIFGSVPLDHLAEMLGQPAIEIKAFMGLAEIPVKEKDVTNLQAEHSCPKCGFSW